MAAKPKIIIVGAGLFGMVAAALCRKNGYAVTVFGDNDSSAASIASGCLMRDSWFNALSKEDVRLGYTILDDLYGVQDLSFKNTGLLSGVRVKVRFVDPDKILAGPKRDAITSVQTAVVEEVGDGYVKVLGRRITGTVLVAAGARSASLVIMPSMVGLVGLSMRFKGQIKEPMMRCYAPYRQAMAFNINADEVWYGDGTAIQAGNWNTEARLEMAKARAREYFGLKFNSKTRVNVGVRPSVIGYKAGYFARVSDKTFVSTGGAKNGTLLAAIQSHRFLEELKK